LSDPDPWYAPEEQLASGTKLVFHPQSGGWVLVDGLVSSHARYCARVTSVLSMQ
jgi:hypothetical protein